MKKAEPIDWIVEALNDIQAINIVVLDVRNFTSVTDYMIICSGNSSRQVKSLCDNLLKVAATKKIKALGVEGDPDSGWILVDLNDAIVHIMQPQVRNFYNLERLWEIPEKKQQGME